MGNINEEILDRKMAFNKVYNDLLDTNEKANRAKIRVEGTEEYRAMETAKNTFVEAVELMRSLKYYLKAKETEYRSSYQQ